MSRAIATAVVSSVVILSGVAAGFVPKSPQDLTPRNVAGKNAAILQPLVVQGAALVSFDAESASVRTVTTFPIAPVSLPSPPQVKASCEKAGTWTLSGVDATGPTGQAIIHLNGFLPCATTRINGSSSSQFIGGNPSFTATPYRDAPVFITCTINGTPIRPPAGQSFSLPDVFDIVVRIKSWNHDGTPAPNVTFGWISVARVGTVTNF